MARKKRPYGTGSLKRVGANWVIRWRATEISRDGTKRKVLRYETLYNVTKTKAERILADRLRVASNGKPTRSRMTFKTLVAEWKNTVLPMYKHSTRKNHGHIVEKHLLPRFQDTALSDLTPQSLQAYVAQLDEQGYAPKTIDHIHDVLSAVLRTAAEWGHIPENPARGLRLPRLTTVRPKWALTQKQAANLLLKLPLLAKTMVALVLLTGLRRGELFALRWKSLDQENRCLNITEAVYEGHFDTPKTPRSMRQLPLSKPALNLLLVWKATLKDTPPESLLFSTRSGKPISPNNILGRFVFPACEELGLPRTTWLTFRRTYLSWAHDQGVPHKVIAQLMGHSNVNTTLNVYAQVMDDSLRAANKVGQELFSFVQFSGSDESGEELIH